MWDGSLTGEDILMDACQKLFGNAANEMFAYYKALADSSGALPLHQYDLLGAARAQ